MVALTAKARDARQVRSDDALRTALLSLIGHRAYDKLTVRDIVAEAGVGYATFFRHYPSKDALLDKVAGDELDELMALTAPLLTPADTRTSSLALTAHVGARREVWTALLAGGAASHLRVEFAKRAVKVARPDTVSPWLPMDLGVILGVSGTVEILAWWLRDKPETPSEMVAELLDRLVIKPAMDR